LRCLPLWRQERRHADVPGGRTMTARIDPTIRTDFPAEITLSDWLCRMAPYVTSAEMATIPGEVAALYAADRRTYQTVWAEVLFHRLAYGQSLAEALAALWAQA